MRPRFAALPRSPSSKRIFQVEKAVFIGIDRASHQSAQREALKVIAELGLVAAQLRDVHGHDIVAADRRERLAFLIHENPDIVD